MDYVIVNVRLAGDAFTYKKPFDSALLESHRKKLAALKNPEPPRPKYQILKY